VAEIAEALHALLHGAEEQHRTILRAEGAEDLLVERGQLYLYRDAEHRAKDEAGWRLRREHGLVAEELDRAAIEDLEPEVSPLYARGVFLPGQGHIANPLRHARVVARGVERMGGRVERAEVRALLVEEGRVAGVVTEAGARRADRVVLATGAFSARLLAPLGIEVPLESQRGYHVMLPDPGVTPRRPLVPADRKAFLTPMEEGLRVAGTVEFGGLDRPPTKRRAELLLGDLRRVYPNARVEGAKPFWMGHRPCLPDSLPALGEAARFPGLWCAFGHGHLGLTGAAPTGALLAAHMLGPRPNASLTPYALERFA
jgi:D-amino-acid dehydrogenase